MIIDFYACWKDSAPAMQLSLPARPPKDFPVRSFAELVGCKYWAFRPFPPPLLDGAIHCDDVDGLASGGCL